MIKRILPLFIGAIFLSHSALAQHLEPGFDKSEYIELIKIGSTFTDLPKDSVDQPMKFTLSYRSPEIGFKNRWALWTNSSGTAVINIRATVKDTLTQLVNTYAAMTPATGELELESGTIYKYKLSDNPHAAVHTGYLIAAMYLARDILPKIDSSYKAGIKDYLIFGHSQGGTIAYLLRAYFHQLQHEGRLPPGIRFKTYSSAAPKPGNLYFAYDYELLNRGGWALTVVNYLDAIPESPVSIQTLDDFNEINLFSGAKDSIKKNLKFPQDLAALYVFHKLDEPLREAANTYRKYLGTAIAAVAHSKGVIFTEPKYANTSNYVRTGEQIILMPDEEYYSTFPQDKSDKLVNHYLQTYLYLAGKYH
jgi:hypothetical protein